MIYKIQINRRVRNLKVYEIKRKKGGETNALTKLFLRVLNRNKKTEDEGKMQAA